MKKVFYFLILLSFIFCMACQNASGDSGPSEPVINVARPEIRPGSGEYKEGFKDISISTKTEGAEIFYTLDGSVPTTLSNKYVGTFPIVGSKTVRAIAVVGKNKSPIATNEIVLNAGKTESQLGVIYGDVNLSESLSEDVKNKVKDDTIYIFTDAMPNKVVTSKIGEEYIFDGLDTKKAYSMYFTNKEPGSMMSRSISGTFEENGKPIIAIVIENQIPIEGIGLNVDVALKSTGTISGKVLKYDAEGKVEKDHGGVSVFIPGTSYSAFTDAAGNFVISGVPQGVYNLRAQESNYLPVELNSVRMINNNPADKKVPSCVIKEPFELYFSKGILKGTAVLNDSSVSENAGINVVISNSSNTKSYNAVTKTNGSWGVTDIYPGSYSVEFSKDGYTPVVLNDVVVTGAKTKVIPSVTLQVIGGAVSGNVSLSGKTDYSGISLLLKKNVTPESTKEKSYYGLTDKLGKFTFDNVMPGTYKLTASYPGYATVEKSDILVSKGDVVNGINIPALIESSYSVTGKVLLEGLTKGFEGTNIALADSATLKPVATTTTGIDGTYSFGNVEVGNYVIVASRDGYLTSNETYVNVSASTLTAVDDILLKNAKGSVIGTVSLESSIDFSGINILLKSSSSNKTYSTVTDIDGKYSFSGIEPGMWTIQATKSGYNTKLSEGFSVSAGIISEPVSMELPVSLRSIFGNVTLEGREDYTGVRITATKITSTTEIYSALSNNKGFYALTGMTPGEYIINFSYEGYVNQSSSSINVTKTSSVKVDSIELKKATGAITGVVNLQGCTDHSGIKVSLVGTDYAFTTKADGVYHFDVPAGNYPGGVRFEKEDFGTTAKADTIPVLNDSTYAVLDVEMKCNAITVKGKIDLFGKDDDSGIKVSIDGITDKGFSTTTKADGTWELKHVPLGYKTFRFQKEFAADVTTEIQIEPGLLLDLGSIQMMPNAATLKGYAFLKGMSDNRNITVTVKTPGKDDIVVKTTSDGMFEATNIIATGKHTVIFSKEGWNSKTIEVSNLVPMKTTVIGKNKEYVLTDTTAPVWNGEKSIVLNDGANFANSTDVKFELSVEDKGSGIDQMCIQVARAVDNKETAKYPATLRWEDYKVGFTFDLQNLPQDYLGSGTYVFYVTVRDRAGNTSTSVKKSITLTNLVTTLSGILTGPRLHLTKVCSPYIVEADCLVPENAELIIDPGTEIRFAGNYSIAVSGTVKARGTPEEKIIFTKTADAPVLTEDKGYWDEAKHEHVNCIKNYYWKGLFINGGFLSMVDGYNYSDGNIMENCVVEYAYNPLTVKGSSYIKNNDFRNNAMPASLGGKNTFIIGNSFENGIEANWGDSREHITIINNKIRDRVLLDKENADISNNNFYDSVVYIRQPCNIHNNNFEKSTLNVTAYLYEYNNKDFSINNNNFIDCSSPIFTTDYEYKIGFNYNIKGNYYGSGNTEELEIKGKESNISFIKDYYDDFKLMRFDYSDWSKTPFEICGYNKNGVILFDYYINGFNKDYQEIKDNRISIEINPLLNENSLSSVKVAQNSEELKTASWQPYSTSLYYNLDTNKLVDGMATVLVQVKDSIGNVSSVVRKEIPFDTAPTASIKIKDDVHYSGRGSDMEIPFECYDNGQIVKQSFFIDDVLYETWNHGYSQDESFHLPVSYISSGKHVLKYAVYDRLGNKGEASKIFYVDRTVDNSIYAGKSFDSGTGQLLKDSGTLYLWHLDSDGSEVDGNASLNMNCNSARGGFNGSAGLYNNQLPLDTGSEFTIEFWGKGENFNLSRSDSFEIGHTYFQAYYKDSIDGTINYESFGFSLLNDTAWHFYSFVFTENYLAFYRDGLIIKYKKTDKPINVNSEKVSIYTSEGSIMDELRFSNCARSCDEISTYYKSAKKILDSNSGSLDAVIW